MINKRYFNGLVKYPYYLKNKDIKEDIIQLGNVYEAVRLHSEAAFYDGQSQFLLEVLKTMKKYPDMTLTQYFAAYEKILKDIE